MGGPDRIRFRFRSKSDDIDIMLEGTEKLVNSARSSIGMNGAMGFVREISTANGTGGKGNSQSEDGRISNIEQSLPGPPPDPSRIPSVVRTVGELDLEGEISALGASNKPTQTSQHSRNSYPRSSHLSPSPTCSPWIQWQKRGSSLSSRWWLGNTAIPPFPFLT